MVATDVVLEWGESPTTHVRAAVDMRGDVWAREMRVTRADRTFWHCPEVSQLAHVRRAFHRAVPMGTTVAGSATHRAE
jgi:hypothetical protein